MLATCLHLHVIETFLQVGQTITTTLYKNKYLKGLCDAYKKSHLLSAVCEMAS